MKIIGLLSAVLSFEALAQTELPERIVNAIAGKALSERRDNSADEEETNAYLADNWKLITTNIHILPKMGVGSASQSGVKDSSISVFTVACERLPPLEYLDYLEKMLILYEQKEISDNAVESILLVQEQKSDFLSVNWEHPRVKAILAKAKKLIPPSDVSLLSCVDDMASGALADNYLTNKDDDAPRPETLPGIKLKRPWDSLIKKYERLTGKKLEEPYDPIFNPRPGKRDGTPDTAAQAIADASPATKIAKSPWLIGGILLLAIAYAVRVFRKRKA